MVRSRGFVVRSAGHCVRSAGHCVRSVGHCQATPSASREDRFVAGRDHGIGAAQVQRGERLARRLREYPLRCQGHELRRWRVARLVAYGQPECVDVAQRTVADREIRIMGSKNDLLRTLVAAQGGNRRELAFLVLYRDGGQRSQLRTSLFRKSLQNWT